MTDVQDRKTTAIPMHLTVDPLWDVIDVLVPDNARAWCWLGQACAGDGDLGKARAAYERAIALAGDGTDAPELLVELDG